MKLSFVRIVSLVFLAPTLACSADAVRVRDRHIPCAIYLAEAAQVGGVRVIDDTNAVSFAPLDIKKFDEALKELSHLPDGRWMVVGLPLYGRESQGFLKALRETLEANGIKDPDVRNLPRPGGGLAQKAVEELRYLLPHPMDYQDPVKTEVASGLGALAVSETGVAVFAFAFFPKPVAAGLIVAGLAHNIPLTVYRRSMGNWINRSTGRFWEKFSKETLVSMVASGCYYTGANWQECGSQPLASAVREFFVTQWPSMVNHGIFFATTFSGIYLWDQIKSRTPEGNAEVRRTAPVLFGSVFTITSPLLILASTMQPIVDLSIPLTQMSIGLNGAQIALGVLAVNGLAIWRWPLLLNSTVPLVEYGYYRTLSKVLEPLGRLTNKLFQKLLQAKEEKPAEEPTVD